MFAAAVPIDPLFDETLLAMFQNQTATLCQTALILVLILRRQHRIIPPRAVTSGMKSHLSLLFIRSLII